MTELQLLFILLFLLFSTYLFHVPRNRRTALIQSVTYAFASILGILCSVCVCNVWK